MRMPDEPGVLVRGVMPDSPAERAGLTPGDVILSVGGEVVSRPAELIATVGQRQPGQRVALSVRRMETDRLLSATLEAQPSEETLMRRRFVAGKAPAFSVLTSVRGNVEPDLAKLRGNVVVIEFWASWCVPCRLTSPLLSAWHDRHAAEGLRVVGITSDTVDLAAHGALESNMSYAVFSDPSGETIRTFRAYALPTLFVIDKQGVVRDVVVGLSVLRYREVDRLIGTLLAER